MRGHDVIFDLDKRRIGFVEADISFLLFLNNNIYNSLIDVM